MERDRDEAARLDVYGDRNPHIFAVQGFLFFGNGRRVVEFVRAWLDGAHDNAHYAILDLAHATGADASAVDALLEAARLVQATHRREVPALYVCGAHEDVQAGAPAASGIGRRGREAVAGRGLCPGRLRGALAARPARGQLADAAAALGYDDGGLVRQGLDRRGAEKRSLGLRRRRRDRPIAGGARPERVRRGEEIESGEAFLTTWRCG